MRDLCIKILWDNLCKISVSGSLCEDPLDHLYQDPVTGYCVGTLVQDLCSRMFCPTVSGSYKATCTRSLYQDPVGPLLSGSCRTTSARSLSQDLCVRVLLDHLHQDLVNEQILRDLLENYRPGLPKGASYARLPRKLKVWSSKTSVLYETSSKTEDPELQN